ncbi:MAG: succinylglutamate desuccinylase/aspartoacylase family protein [Cyclobacteriaceae bacterium]
MTETKTAILSEALDVQRVMGIYPKSNEKKGTVLLISGAVHGNEPSGLQALKRVFHQLDLYQPDIIGKVIGITGNLRAVKERKRLIDKDLNRVCTPDLAQILKNGQLADFHEAGEFQELLKIVEEIELNINCTAIKFVDLHTTSSNTAPYISVNKKSESLDFANKIPLPVASGIEDFIPGHFDHFLTLRGHIGFTVEGGQHEDPRSVDHHEAVIWQTLVKSGLIDQQNIPKYSEFEQKLKEVSVMDKAFRVIHRHEIMPSEEFLMKDGFNNFDKILKGEILAYTNGQPVLSQWDGHIFLPLYQQQGNDGFFVIKESDGD